VRITKFNVAIKLRNAHPHTLPLYLIQLHGNEDIQWNPSIAATIGE
jgi:hypothetical protein